MLLFQNHINQYDKAYQKENPWSRSWHNINARIGKKSYKNIKNYLTFADLKFLWLRDKAYKMKRPSIDRKDSKKDYILYGSWQDIESIYPSSLYLIKSEELKNYICEFVGFIKSCQFINLSNFLRTAE